ncbi:MAG: ribosome maturation factor RimP [Myxococcales bacterium]|nr:ribosome maturation factor RimP [Myxococcales bacterium]
MSAAPTTSTSPEEIAVGEGPARQVEDALAETAALLGYEILLVEWAGTGRGRILRIYLDHPDGVTLDDCTRMGRVLSDALDAAEADPAQPALAALLGQPYNLEVSSPGIDRPIQKLSDFARFVGYTAP